ncbi:MAG: hypothetical protein J6Q54_01750 [Oscillospiraceae bacterium]|nr:hypothetical protein [Oscillospiraceae bacterium]
MNTLESTITISPGGIEEECALFTVDTTSSPFIFSNITSIGNVYTLTIWVKADANYRMITAGNTIDVTTEWKQHIFTYTADSKNLYFYFQNTGSYYIYHSQLEIGTVSTDWRPSPEDTGDDIDAVNQNLQVIQESFAQLSVNADGITEIVSKTEETINTLTGEVESTKQEILEVRKESNQLVVDIQKITNDGVEKVTNTTGTFDEAGLTIDNSESPTKTQITPDGMIVKRKAGGIDEDVLTATSSGVEATNLHAKTYLIVGGRSRFENYSSNRTGCFWIGED